MSEHALLTSKEVAKLLNIPKPTVYYYAKKGGCLYPAAVRLQSNTLSKSGGRYRFRKSAILAIINKKQPESPPKGIKCLIVDNEKGMRKLLSEAITSDFVMCESLAQAQEVLAGNQDFTHLVTDHDLGDGYGFQLITEYDSWDKIIMISSHDPSVMVGSIPGEFMDQITFLQKNDSDFVGKLVHATS